MVLAELGSVDGLLSAFSGNGGIFFQGLADSPPMAVLGWLSLVIGGIFVIYGHASRSSNKRGDELMMEQIRTWATVFFMLTGPTWLAITASTAEKMANDYGMGPITLTRRCMETALAMPEYKAMFDTFNAAQQQQAENDAAQQAKQAEEDKAVSDALGDGGVVGWTKALFTASWQGIKHLPSDAAGTILALGQIPVMIVGGLLMMFKLLLAVILGAWMMLCMCFAAICMWGMKQMQYFLLVTGASLMPMFVASWALPQGHFFSNPGRSYVLKLGGTALWPLAWMIGHCGTVALFNGFLAILSGTGLLSAGVQSGLHMVYDHSEPGNLADTVTTTGVVVGGAVAATGSVAATASAVMAGITAAPVIWLGMAVLAALGLALWIFMVTFMGPIWLNRMLTEGAAFFADGAQSSLKAAAEIGGTAASAAATSAAGNPTGGLAQVMGGSGGISAMAGAGSALQGAASGRGMAGMMSGLSAGISQSADLQRQETQAAGTKSTAAQQQQMAESLSAGATSMQAAAAAMQALVRPTPGPN